MCSIGNMHCHTTKRVMPKVLKGNKVAHVRPMFLRKHFEGNIRTVQYIHHASFNYNKKRKERQYYSIT